ncbi:DUF2891 domain-containing protein [Umezawaea sp. Da 62-37]|uniref:DUF2891 domain-containing protein n=1 Tax=Umezawaea sp. Da 62-37 TaxID=3075927 RepID=UPI0028F72E67|nr:DUF2891 domain-containing protein [Umezawaea sp. Da 62-37]WNV83564.1 DUF2891 domain-containing protein [Umezawaea sp. Da 62-37]
MNSTRLDDGSAARLLATAVANVQRDHPVHWTHMVSSDADLVSQRTLHPVFAGSYDWHSCVHQTWLAVRLVRLRPDLEGAAEAVAVLDSLLTPEKCEVEAEFFRGQWGKHWERPYGWAWLLVLDAELKTWDSETARRWSTALAPLTDVLRDRFLTWASTARLPVRVGTHGNTAFATGMVLDAARAVDDVELTEVCVEAALRWHREDVGYGGFEPDAPDFLSPALVESDLMLRVLDTGEFATWFEAFLPNLDEARWKVLREPVPVDDPTDAYGSHLAGLALSRAWNWLAIAEALPEGHRYRDLALTAGEAHREAGWRYVFGHGYAAEHWLGTFAAYLDLGAY